MLDIIISSSIGFVGVFLGSLLTYLFNVKAKNKEIDRLFEMYKSQQASKIAEFLSLWVIAEPKENREDKLKLNQLSYEMSLWLPDDIYNELSKTLQNVPDAKNPKEVLIAIRKIYHGVDDTLRAETIIHW